MGRVNCLWVLTVCRILDKQNSELKRVQPECEAKTECEAHPNLLKYELTS